MDTSTGLCQLVKRISICMDKRKKNGERFVNFSQMKDIGGCLKSAVWELLPYVYYFYKKGFKYCN